MSVTFLAVSFWISILLQESFAQLEGSTLYTRKLSWNEANQYCMSINQNLLTIDSFLKGKIFSHEFLRSTFNISVTEFWIGLHAADPHKTDIHTWSDHCSTPSFTHWSHNTGSSDDNLCTYVSTLAMLWHLDSCVNVRKAFVCEEQRSVGNSGFYYQVLTAIKGDASRSFSYHYTNVNECEDICETEASTGFCWGFMFNSDSVRCRLYDQIDDPFYNDVNQSPTYSYFSTHIRRHSYTFLVDSSPIITTQPVLDCGNRSTSCSVCNTNYSSHSSDHQTLMTTQEHTTTIQFTNDGSTTASNEMTASTQTTATHYISMTTNDLPTKSMSLETTTTQDVSGTTNDLPTESISLETTTTHHGAGATDDIQTVFLQATTQQNVSSGPLYCQCTCPDNTTVFTFEETFQEILNQLKVDKSQTSSAKRKLTCEEDDRPTSASIGYFGVFILVSVFSVVILFDCYGIIIRLRTCCSTKQLRDF